MRPCRRRQAVTAVLLGLAALLAAGTAAAARPFTEIVVEGGAALPLGDLHDDYFTPKGFGAGTGYAVGFRFREQWLSGWAVSPSFHYVKFDKFVGTRADPATDFESKTSLYRYGFDVEYHFPARRGRPRWFVTFGAALIRNRLREDYIQDDSYFEDGVNSVAAAAGVGVRTGDFEIAVRYTLDRFETLRFWPGVDSYNWDHVLLTVGFALPRAY